MNSQSTNITDICNDLAILTSKSVEEIDKGLEEQLLRLDIKYNELLQSVQKDKTDYVPEKKISKRLSKTKHVGDIFSAASGFQQPAIPPVRRTRRQASILSVDKMKSVRESATISSGTSTRASRAKGYMASFIDISPLNCPKANSTFVVDKKLMNNREECLSPEMFSPNIELNTKPTNPNKTYDMPLNATKESDKNIHLTNEKSPIDVQMSNPVKLRSSTRNNCIEKSEESLKKNKRREKLEDINVNIENVSLQHMTRTMKRKLEEENQLDLKKTNVFHVPLEKQISTPLKPVEDLLPTPHQIRENEAEKRKELYLRSKADQKKFDDQHLKAAKQREEQMKRVEEKMIKAAEEKRKKESKQREKELMIKEEALKKQKQAELRLAQMNAKRKQAEETKKLKMLKAESDRKLKENEIKKKNDLQSEKSKSIRPKVITPNLPISSIPKVVTLPNSKTENIEINKNDYGLNDISARDSSDDESGPKKPVPSWAKRENRKAVLELQYFVDSTERDLFFDCPKSMSLKEMFKGWNIRDKQRTSSAVWNTPPRYSEYIRRY